MHDTLVDQFNDITPENMPDVNDRIRALTILLENPELKKHLSRKEVANIFYNRSLDYVVVAEQLFDEGRCGPDEARKANRILVYQANSDIHNAELRYGLRPSDAQNKELYREAITNRKICQKCLKEIRALRKKCFAVFSPDVSFDDNSESLIVKKRTSDEAENMPSSSFAKK